MLHRAAALMVAAAVAAPGIAAARPLVVLDPGHGGSESGAKSPSGILEKHVVLSVAHFTASELRDLGYRVILTRESDADLALGARISIANRRGAAVFVSIHANAAPVRQRRGVESYILSAQASDEATRALLRQEEGYSAPAASGHGHADDLSAILSDLAQTQAHADAARLARRIQDALGRVSGLKPSRGLRQAPFAVLKGARMPAVLVELGYLTNPTQARFLANPSGQREAAERLARGIVAFLRSRRHR